MPPKRGRTVTTQSPAWMRTFSLSATDVLASAIFSHSPLQNRRRTTQPRCGPAKLHVPASSVLIEGRSLGCSRLPADPNQNWGNCTSARCRLRLAQAEKIDCASADALSGVSAFIFQTTISSSGVPAVKRFKPAVGTQAPIEIERRRRPFASPAANSPSGLSGSSLWVAQRQRLPRRPGNTPG